MQKELSDLRKLLNSGLYFGDISCIILHITLLIINCDNVIISTLEIRRFLVASTLA